MVVGVICDRTLSVSLRILTAGFVICLMASVAMWRNDRPVCGVVVTCLLLVAAGMLSAIWHHLWWHQMPSDHVYRLIPVDERETVALFRAVVDSPITKGVISEDWGHPPSKQIRSRCEVQLRQVFRSGAWCPISGRACLTVNGTLQPFPPGTQICFSAFVVRYLTPSNPGESNRCLARREKGFYCFLQSPYPQSVRCEGRVEPGLGWGLSRLRDRCHHVLQRHISEEAYPLAAAVLLGLRDPMPAAQRDLYLRTGTIHLLSISGLHVGLLSGCLLSVARVRPMHRDWAAVLLIGFVVAFCLLAGGRTPVVRASVLVILFSLSWISLRRSQIVNSLATAAIWIVCCRPTDVLSIGSQLSFLSVATLAWVGQQSLFGPPEDPLDRLVWRTRTRRRRLIDACCHQFSRCLFASSLVWLTTAPLVAHHFHIVSPIAILLNALLWVPLLVSMLAGIFMFLLEPCGTFVAGCPAILCEAALEVILFLVVVVDTWPAAHFWCVGPSTMGLVAFYIGLGFLCLSGDRRNVTQLVVLFVAVVLLFGLGMLCAWLGPSRNAFRCTFLAVGHGTCVVLQWPDGATWLYDAGRLGATRRGVEIVSRFLWKQRIFKIDQVVLSHLDVDHYSLIPSLVNRFSVDRLITTTALCEPRADASYLRRFLDRRGVRILTVSEGDRLDPPNCRIRVLGPRVPLDTANDNANSIVLLVESMGTAVVLPGDLEGPRLEQLFQSTSVKAQIAMAPHHGSPVSQPIRFADWCQAEVLIVSSRGDYEHLRARLESLGCELLQTSVNGAAEVIVTERGWRVVTFRRRRPNLPQNGLGSRWRG